MKKFFNISVLLILAITMTGCTEWLMFDFKRIVYGFIFLLVIGVVGFIFTILTDSHH